jgi:hypothetical protein
MGLDIADNTNKVSEKVGSYSRVHELRRYYIELAIEYLKSQKNPVKSSLPKNENNSNDSQPKDDEDDEDDGNEDYDSVEMSTARVIKILQHWITFPFIHFSLLPQTVNYRNISGDVTEDMIRWRMTGLMHFVNCSDSDGAWTYGQCIDILDFFNAIIDFKKGDTRDSEQEKWNFDHMIALRDVYTYAVENKGYVIRC